MSGLKNKLEKVAKEIGFSGVAYVEEDQESFFFQNGYANKQDKLAFDKHTRFGIASGAKIFTAVAIAKLVEQGRLDFQSKLADCLSIVFPYFHQDVTIHYLLTHTSGIPDYFDEEEMDDFEELWQTLPMYRVRSGEDFLPLFQDKKMMFSPGERFHYNNAAFIVLGLVVEELAGEPFTSFVQKHIFDPAGMTEAGYFAFDKLPGNTAIGYIKEKDEYRSNIYALPVRGGADGGVYVSASDMARFWDALNQYKLLNAEFTEELLKPHIQVDEDSSYGYGVWIKKDAERIKKYYVVGFDPGVSFHSAYYPETGRKVVVPSNHGAGPYYMVQAIEE
ncbi:serine hydrolase domain-containing protein [Terribacillus saccharophilus]|uniref:serine hydrolase domain-containing protein n=1 Tax=Terribacillus saccharophilus TaxID=361277 RepID=UPI002DCCDFE8|nr:serine hydrolase [Terribacillus saccharophilus]